MNFWPRLAHILSTRQRWIVAAGVLLAAALAWPLRDVSFSTDIFELLPQSVPAAGAFQDYEANFTQSDDLTVALEVNDPADVDALDQAMPAFAAALRQIEQVASVHYELPNLADPRFGRLLLDNFYKLLDEEELDQLVHRLEPPAIAARVARDRQQLIASPGTMMAERIRNDPLGLMEIGRQHFSKISRSSAQLSQAQPSRAAFGSADGRLRLIQLRVTGNVRNAYFCQRLTDRVRATLEKTRASMPEKLAAGLRFGLTGRCAFAADISRQLRSSIIGSAVSSMLLVMLVFWLGFRRLWPLAAMALALTAAVVSCLGLGAWWFGTLNIITASFAAMLIGLGVDYGILLYNHFSRSSLQPNSAALAEGFRANGSGIVVSALTTAAAFAAVALSPAIALRQFGLLAAIGILMTAGWMLVFFAALFARSKRPEIQPVNGSFGRFITRRSGMILLVTSVMAAAAFALLLSGPHRGVGFDANPNSVRYRNIEADRTLNRILEKTATRQHALIVLQRAPDWSQLAEGSRELALKLKPLLATGAVARVESSAPMLASAAHQRSNLHRLGRLDFQKIKESFTNALEANQFQSSAFAPFLDWLEALRQQAANPEAAPLFDPATLSEYPEWQSLASRLINLRAIETATYVYLPQPISSAAELGEWRKLLGAVGARTATGWDALVAEMQPQLRIDFQKMLVVTLALVLVCLAAAYRRPKLVVLALSPLALAILFLLATMRLCGIEFNIANFFALPLLIGCGIDYGVHVVNGWLNEKGDLEALTRSTGRALTMNALTTVFGFGSLALSDHVGLMTLGFVIGAGVLWMLVCSMIVLPAALHMLEPRPQRKSYALYTPQTFRLASMVARALPAAWIRWLARRCAGLNYFLVPRLRRIVQGNLAPIVKDPAESRRAARHNMENFAESLADYVLYEKFSDEQIRAVVDEATGWERLDAALAEGHGVILVTAHMGNWELGGRLFAMRGYPIWAVTLEEEIDELTDMREEYRGRNGVHTIRIGKSPLAAVPVIHELRQNHIVAMLVDRPPAGSQQEVRLFGGRAKFSSAPAVLSRLTHAVVLPAFVMSVGGGRYRAFIEPPVPMDEGEMATVIAANTQRLAERFERVIRQHADQWYHFVPLWDAKE